MGFDTHVIFGTVPAPLPDCRRYNIDYLARGTLPREIGSHLRCPGRAPQIYVVVRQDICNRGGELVRVISFDQRTRDARSNDLGHRACIARNTRHAPGKGLYENEAERLHAGRHHEHVMRVI